MTDKTEPEKLRDLLSQARAHLAAGRLDAADSVLAAACDLAPSHPNAIHTLGLLRHQQQRSAEALGLLRQAEPALRTDPMACFNFATVLLQRGHYADAVELLRRALAARADFDDAQLQLGVAYSKLGQNEAAAEAFQGVLARRPGHVLALMNLAAVLLDTRPEEALTFAEQAAAAAPEQQMAAALNLRAKALSVNGREDEAFGVYEEVLASHPGDVRATFGRAIALPRVYANREEIDHWRAQYRTRLEAFSRSLRLDSSARVVAAAEAVFALHNFPLPQQGRDDHAEQAIYGDVLHRVAAARHPDLAKPLPPAPRRDRLRVAFVSAFFRQHSIVKTHGRWITGLDPDRFEVITVHTGALRDATTERLSQCCAHFLHHPRADRGLLQALRDFEADVLVYPDLGMEPAMLLPAALRLAPVQCQGLGHPVTSGLPTIDWALSSALMEPEGAQDHYSERLEALPNLSFCYERDRILRERGEADLSHLRRHRVVYICTQNLGKLLPQHDEVFARILAGVPDSELWFVARPEAAVTERFRERLLEACRGSGAAPERVVIHERMGQSDFLALNAAADVYLDGIAWSGNNTTFEAIAMGLPVVTWPGPLMRSRHSFAMLKMMGFTETVAGSADDYVGIAVRLGRDEDWRRAVVRNLREKSGAIYDDETPIRALEDFLLRVARSPGD